MAQIKPFKGLRYNREITGDLSLVITPPYDVIGEEEQNLYYSRSPYNIIRLEYGRSFTGDNSGDNRYTRAADTLRRWLAEKVLLTEDEPVFYIHRHSFRHNGRDLHRTGIIAALELTPYTRGVVLPHEETLSGPKSDRLELLRSCRANFSPIFGLFSDPGRKLEQFAGPLPETEPLLHIPPHRHGQSHRLWAVREPELQRELASMLEPLSIYIADGHHRYETALFYARERHTKLEPGCGYLLAHLVSLEDPGLVILPTHRLLQKLTPGQHKTLENILTKHFQLLGRGEPDQVNYPALAAEMKEFGREHPCFALFTRGRAVLAIPRELPPGETLDVEILRRQVIHPLFAGTPTETKQRLLTYTHDGAEAARAVTSGDAAAAFLLNPTPIGAVTQRSRRGEVMPEKSTYFYPKLPSGLVLYHHDLSPC